jgi:hypothetical protein
MVKAVIALLLQFTVSATLVHLLLNAPLNAVLPTMGYLTIVLFASPWVFIFEEVQENLALGLAAFAMVVVSALMLFVWLPYLFIWALIVGAGRH